MEKHLIVTEDNFKENVQRFLVEGYFGSDTETFGLRWHDQHKLFSIQLSDEFGACYFNFLAEPDHLGNLPNSDLILPLEKLKELGPVFQNPYATWFLHNAKFDMGMLDREGLCPTGSVHCTEAVARVVDPSHRSYRLSECMKRMAEDLKQEVTLKSDAVWDYIMENKLYDEIRVPGKDKPVIDPHFNLVPFEILFPYGCIDTIATRELGLYQIEKLKVLRSKSVNIQKVCDLEKSVTKALFKMEKNGMLLDKEYTQSASDLSIKKCAELAEQYKSYTGQEFVNSAQSFESYFKSKGVELDTTKDGNLSASKFVLQKIVETTKDPVASIILEWRKHDKLVATYFSSYLYFVSNRDGAIHPSARQGGTRTGRLSMMDPNLQNVPKPPDPDDLSPEDDLDEGASQVVRSCFIPPQGECLFMPDYDQMEYRLMLDRAGEMGLISMINDGLDVHSATAELIMKASPGLKVTRKQAKTINFMLLYGGGIQKLADALKLTYYEARDLRALYFKALPKVQAWTKRCQAFSKTKIDFKSGAVSGGYIINWYGRWYPIDRGFEYKSPNYVIQGGCADVVKLAMVETAKLLEGKKAKFRLQVHDELIFSIPKDELELAPKIVEIMEGIYKPTNGLKLTAGALHSWTNWGEKVDGYPS